jgi:hypothetical protein
MNAHHKNNTSYCGNKMPTRCNRWVFIADLIAYSTCFGHHYAHHQELESIIQVVAVCRIWCLVFKLSVLCVVAGCVSGLRVTRKPDNLKTKHQIRQAETTCIILSSSWWWALWSPKHVEQAIRSAIKNSSVASSWHFIPTLSTMQVKTTSNTLYIR